MVNVTMVELNRVDCSMNKDPDCQAAYWLWRTVPFVLLTIGTLGNILNLVVLAQPPLRKYSTTVYLLFLSASDMFFLYFSLLPDTNFSITGDRFADHSEFFCKIRSWIGHTAASFSVWLLVLLTIERMLLTSSPIKMRALLTPTLSVKVSVIALCLLCLFNLHCVYGFVFYDNSEDIINVLGKKMLTQHCTFVSRSYMIFYETTWTVTIFIIYSIIPGVLIFFGNIAIAYYVVKHRKRLHIQPSSTCPNFSKPPNRISVTRRRSLDKFIHVTEVNTFQDGVLNKETADKLTYRENANLALKSVKLSLDSDTVSTNPNTENDLHCTQESDYIRDNSNVGMVTQDIFETIRNGLSTGSSRSSTKADISDKIICKAEYICAKYDVDDLPNCSTDKTKEDIQILTFEGDQLVNAKRKSIEMKIPISNGSSTMQALNISRCPPKQNPDTCCEPNNDDMTLSKHSKDCQRLSEAFRDINEHLRANTLQHVSKLCADDRRDRDAKFLEYKVTQVKHKQFKKSPTRMLFTLTVIYLITTLPYCIFHIVSSELDIVGDGQISQWQLGSILVLCLGWCNFTFNFVLYFVSGSLFKQEFLRIRSKIKLKIKTYFDRSR